MTQVFIGFIAQFQEVNSEHLIQFQSKHFHRSAVNVFRLASYFLFL